MENNGRDLFEVILRGGRFTRGELPMEYLWYLSVWDDLLRQLARDHFFSQNPHRSRVPVGFDDHFKLKVRLTEGSSKVGFRPAGDTPELFADPHHLGALDAVRTMVTTGEPGRWVGERSLSLMNRALSGRMPLEELAFNDSVLPHQREVVVSTKVVHKLLASAQPVGAPKDSTFAAVGEVYRFNLAAGSFAIFNRETRSRRQFTLNAHCQDQVVASVGGGLVWISGPAQYYDNAPPEVEISQAKVVFGPRMDPRFAELRALKHGWFDGEGTAPGARFVNKVREYLWGIIESRGVDRPYLYPTCDGGIVAEWDTADSKVDLEFTPDGGVNGGSVRGGDCQEVDWEVFDSTVGDWLAAELGEDE